jgi:hypothetical protein
VSILKRIVDERFLMHRQRSTSIAGMCTAALALCLFLYRHYTTGVWNLDLLVVGAGFAVIKLGLMTWYAFTD